MRNAPNQGLAGKARRQRHRSRTTRLYQQQLIEDYLHTKNRSAEPTPDRSIPIGHRKEFAPTAASGLDDSAAGQLELSLTPVDEDRDAVFVAVPKAKAGTLHPAKSSNRYAAPREVAQPVVAGQPAGMRRPVMMDRAHAMNENDFTWGGFAFGCAIGGAAAAVLLVFIRIAFA